jgi:hypothetical protein
MDKDSFTQWLEDPVTRYFIKYLKDSAKAETTFIAEAIMSGEVIPLDDQIRVSTLNMTLVQISEIGFSEIQEFYEK